jgi:hypothetical protein
MVFLDDLRGRGRLLGMGKVPLRLGLAVLALYGSDAGLGFLLDAVRSVLFDASTRGRR